MKEPCLGRIIQPFDVFAVACGEVNYFRRKQHGILLSGQRMLAKLIVIRSSGSHLTLNGKIADPSTRRKTLFSLAVPDPRGIRKAEFCRKGQTAKNGTFELLYRWRKSLPHLSKAL